MPKADNIEVHQFDGVQPAAWYYHTWIRIASKTVWSINYQDVIDIAKLFETSEV